MTILIPVVVLTILLAVVVGTIGVALLSSHTGVSVEPGSYTDQTDVERLMPGCDGRGVVPVEWRDPARSAGDVPGLRDVLAAAAVGECFWCGTWLPQSWHGDHYPHAHAVGGRTVPGNMVASCPPCNLTRAKPRAMSW